MAGEVRSVAVASDHAGVEMKRRIREALEARGVAVEDLGPRDEESVDYPDYAEAVARSVSGGRAERGILVCGTGLGMCIAANKHPGIRAALLYDTVSARFAREHNDANVAVFGARTMSMDDVLKRLGLFLDTPFEGGRHGRRLEKITRAERARKE